MSQTKAQLIDPVDGTIVNADINASAAIAGCKISPDFGSQTVTASNLTLSDNDPIIQFTDANNDPDYRILVESGIFRVQDTTNGNAERLAISSSGNVGIGTTSPQNDLHIHEGSSASSVIQITNTSTGSGASDGFQFGVNSSAQAFFNMREAAPLLFTINDSERMRLDSDGRLLIGTSSSRAAGSTQKQLQIEGTNGASSSLSLIRNQNNNDTAVLYFAKTRHATVGGSTIVQDDDNLGDITFAGADGTDITSVAARIFAAVDGTPGSNDMPGRLVFSTTADGAASPTTRLTIDSAGLVKLPDNGKFVAGAGGDVSIFHNGTNSFISNTTGNLQIDSDAEVQVNATTFRVKNAADSELMATFSQNGKVTLYNDNVQAARTETNGFAVLGGEGSDANLFFFADEADDVADQWRIQALAASSKLEFRNREDGNYRINAEMIGGGHVKLYNDNNQRFATFAGGSIVYGQWRQAESNGNTRTMKTVVTNGLASGETLSFQDTSLNFHGFGEVTVILRHNSTSTQATMKKFPISIRSTANAGLGSEIYSINAATAGQSMTVTGVDRGVNVTNNNAHSCTCTVILDLIIFA